MTIQQLEYFLAVSRSLNFTKTAESFFISQSAITQQIKNLEEELKVSLFIRKNRKVSLTEAGIFFSKETEAILSQIKNSVEKARAVHNGMNGILNIGYLESMEMTRFPKSVQNFYQKYPSIHINLNREYPISLYDNFLNDKYDVIFNINHRLFDYSGFYHRQIGSYPFYVVMPPEHPLTSKERISQPDLKYEKLIVHDMKRKMGEESEIIPDEYLKYNFKKNIIKVEHDVETILIMVASGIGLAILPEFNIRYPQINLNLIYVPLDTGEYRETINVIAKDPKNNLFASLFLKEV